MKSVLSQCDVTCENVDDDIAEIVEQMDDLGYSVTSGYFQLYNAETSDIYIPFAKPDTDYLISYFEAEQSNSMRIGGRDSIVWRGCTPPEVTYFNYRSYKMKNLADSQTETYSQSSLGDSINDLVVNVESNDATSFTAPYDRRTNIITTGDDQTWTDLVTIYENAGLLTEYAVNLDAINSSDSFTYSESELDYPRDEITIIYEIQFDPDSPCEKESYLNQSFPFKVFYAYSQDDIEPRSPFNLPSRDTSVDTQDCEVDTVNYWDSAVTELTSSIQDHYGYYLESNTEFTDAASTSALSNGDNLDIFQHGSYCNKNSLDCMFDNPDTYYSWDGQEHTLEDNDLYLLIGLNHDDFGLSTTNSLSIARVTDPDGDGHEFEIIDSEFGIGQIWVVQITRPENCLNSNDYPYAMCLDKNTLGPDENFIFFAEATLNPSTKTRPDPDCLINWRLLHFKTTSPTESPTEKPSAEPTPEPSIAPTQPTIAPTKGFVVYEDNNKYTYDEAKAKCEADGMQLPTIIGQTDVDLVIASGIETGFFAQRVWVGLTDNDVNGVWKWEDGTGCEFDTDDCIGSKLTNKPVHWYQKIDSDTKNCGNVWLVDDTVDKIEVTNVDCSKKYASAVLCMGSTPSPTTHAPTPMLPTVSPDP